MKKEMDIEKLNELYSKAEEADKKTFAEMRSNLLLVNGDHYKRVSSDLDRRLRNSNVDKKTRIRLTMNHTQKATSDIKDIILNQASSFSPFPKNESELGDQKSAELAKSVWEHGKSENDWEDLQQNQINSFVDVGECAAKIYFDPSLGNIKSYPQLTTEEGIPLFNYDGNIVAESISLDGTPLEPAPDLDNPNFLGKLIIEKLYPFNLLRSPNSNSMKNSPYIIHRKMVDVDIVKNMFASGNTNFDRDLRERITESSNKTYKIFDSSTNAFYDSSGQVMLKEYFFRKSKKYPKGYFYITTESDILSQGEIPFGEHGDIAFPIKHTGYDIIETSPRYSSSIRHMRPFQAEINRAASSRSEIQLIFGKDKLVLHGGGMVSKGAELEGTRVLNVTGPKPDIIPGRSGDQFTGHLLDMIEGLRDMAGLPNDNNSKAVQTMDPKSELFKSAKLKKKFSRQALRFERFSKECVETYLFLASKYLDDEVIIRAIGKKEKINIAEFKAVDRLDYAIKVEPVSGDYDSQWGKFMELEIISQYLGKDMPEHLKGALIKSFPYLNKDPVMKDILVEYESPRNMLLAIDRGEDFIASKYDNADLMLKALYQRSRESDFKELSPEIQDKYAATIVEFEEIQKQQIAEEIKIKNGMIPTDGALIKCDLYVSQPNTKGGVKTVREVFPSAALEWLREKLNSQGLSMERLKDLGSKEAASDIAEKGQMLGENLTMQAALEDALPETLQDQ